MNSTLKLVFGCVLTIALAGSANATLIDGFGDALAGGDVVDGSLVSDSPFDAQSTTQIVTNPAETDLVNNNRTVTVERTSLGGSDVVGEIIDPTGNLSTPNFAYNHSQSAFTQGYSLIDWDFDTLPLGSPITISVEILQSDLGGLLTLALFTEDTVGLWDGSVAGLDGLAGSYDLIESKSIPGTTPPNTNTVSFQFFAGTNNFDLITRAALVVDGRNLQGGALDVVVDFVDAQVPEPSTLAVFGLGLVSLAFASRRRRS